MNVLKLVTSKKASLALYVAIITALLLSVVPFHVNAASVLLTNRSDQISDSAASVTATHLFGFTMTDTTQAVGSISFEFCSNTPIIGDVCTASAGLDVSAAVLTDQTGETGFSIHTDSTSSRIILTRTPANPTGVPSTYQFDDITNPSDPGSHYVRLQTYASTDATGVDLESGGVVYAILPGLSVSAEVPPYIRFCAGITIVGFDCATANTFFIDLGLLDNNNTSTGSSQFLVATNAASGYSVTLSGTTMVSGNNVIPGMAAPGSSAPGTSQFGINLRSNSNPSVGQNVVGAGTANPRPDYNAPNQFKFQQGDVLVGSPVPNDNRKFTVSYIVNISPNQQPGVYATTISYICLANF